MIGPFFCSLSENQIHFIRSPFTREEIKRTVWDCGSSKALGQDGFYFDFLRDIETYWRMIWWPLCCIFILTHLFIRDVTLHFFTVIPNVKDPKNVSDLDLLA